MKTTLGTRRFVLRAGAAACAAAFLAACSRKPSFLATDISDSGMGKDLSLTDFDGRPRSLQEFKGKILVVFFGYAQCPDVCPTTLAEFVQVKSALGADGDRLQVVFVTVDPERDTGEVLKQYVTQFDPSFLALRGDEAATARVARSFKVFYQKVPGQDPGSYTMDHTAGIYIFDTEGRLRLFAKHDSGADALAADIRKLF